MFSISTMHIVLVTFAFCFGGFAFVLWLALRRRIGSRPPRGTIRMSCSVCQEEIVFGRQELVPLSAPEIGLVVRSVPQASGRPMAEYVCPHCEAAHCFATDRRDPELLGVNFYNPQTTSAHCFDCRRPLRRPTWPRRQYDGRIHEIPELLPDYGLVCEFCKAVCCVDCCTKATKKRTKDGSLLCPRCFRAPLQVVFHP